MHVYTVEHNTGPSWSSDPITIVSMFGSKESATALFEQKYSMFMQYHVPEEGQDGYQLNRAAYGNSMLPNAKPIYRCCADGWWWGIFEHEISE